MYDNREVCALKQGYLQDLLSNHSAAKKHYNLKIKSLRKQATKEYIEKCPNKPKAKWGMIKRRKE